LCCFEALFFRLPLLFGQTALLLFDVSLLGGGLLLLLLIPIRNSRSTGVD